MGCKITLTTAWKDLQAKNLYVEPGVFETEEFLKRFGNWTRSTKLVNRANRLARVNADGSPMIFMNKRGTKAYSIAKNGEKIILENTLFHTLPFETRSIVSKAITDRLMDEFKFLNDGKIENFLSNTTPIAEAYDTIVESIIKMNPLLPEFVKVSLVESKLDYIKAMVRSLNSFGIKYTEKAEEDREGLAEGELGRIKQVPSYQRRTQDKASLNIKLKLGFLPAFDANGLELIDPLFSGSVLLMDPTIAWGVLLDQFRDIPNTLDPTNDAQLLHFTAAEGKDVTDAFMKKLKSLEKTYPWTESLYSQLEGEDNLQDRLEFFTAFKNSKNSIYTVTWKDNEFTVQNTEDSGSDQRYILADWVDTIAENLITVDTANNSKIKAIQTAREDIRSVIKDTLKKSSTVSYDSKWDAVYVTTKSLFDKFGIDMYSDLFTKEFNKRYDSKNAGLKEGSKQPEELFLKNYATSMEALATQVILAANSKENPEGKLRGELTALLKSLSKSQNDLTSNMSNHMATVGENRVYLYSLPTILSEQLNQLKDNPAILDEFLKLPWQRNSLLAKELQNTTKLNKLVESLGLAGVLQLEDSQENADSKAITKSDFLRVDIFNVMNVTRRGENSVHNPLYDFQLPADKGRQIKLQLGLFKETKDAKDAADTIYGYVKDEYLEMVNAANEITQAIKDETNQSLLRKEEATLDVIEARAAKRLKLGYHLNSEGTLRDKFGVFNGNAFKFRLIPAMEGSADTDQKSAEILKFKLGLFNGATGLPLGATGNITESVKKSDFILNDSKTSEPIKEIITKHIEKRTQAAHDRFLEEGNDVAIHLDKKIVNHYRAKAIKPLDSNLTIPQIAVNDIFRDYIFNNTISKIEISKLFTGSLQHYKHDADYIKRVPGTLVDGLIPATGLTAGDTKFNQWTFSTENYAGERESLLATSSELDASVRNQYKFVDRTDAQGWMTPKRWQFLMERTGQFGKSAQGIFNKMEAQWAYVKKGEVIPDDLKLTPRENKLLSAQPQKWGHFKNDFLNGPTYLKYSLAVLTPEFVANAPRAKALLDAMERNGIDEAVAETGVKVGAIKPMSIDDLLAGESPVMQTLDNRNSRWQQVLSSKGIHANKIGTQIQKVIVDHLRFMPGVVHTDPVTGVETTGTQLANEIDNNLRDLQEIGFRNFKRSWGLSDRGTIIDKEAFYDKVIKEMDSTDDSLVRNVLDVLEYNYPINALPSVEAQILKSFLSSNKKFTTELITNGGAFIQISDHLTGQLSADVQAGIKLLIPHSDLKAPTVEVRDGRKTVIPGQVMIPYAKLRKLIPDFESMKQEDLYEMLNSPHVLEMIGYRIPTQARSSTDLFQIVGILPESAGDSVIAYGEITAKTGSDFDIDKMFFMLPALEMVDGKVQLITEGDAGVQNRVFISFTKALSSPELYNTMMTSVDNDTTESVIETFIPAIEKISFEVFDPLVSIDKRYEFKMGAGGIGEAVNAMNDSIRSQARGMTLDAGLGTWANKEMDFKDSQPLSDEDLDGDGERIGLLELVNNYRASRNKPAYTREDLRVRPITGVLSELTNGFVDIANKNAYITRGNFGPTMNAYATMLLRAGVHPYKVTVLLAQPSVREYVNAITTKRGIIENEPGFKILNGIIQQLQIDTGITQDYKIGDTKLSDLDYLGLLDTAMKAEATTQEQLMLQLKLLSHIKLTQKVVKKYGWSIASSKTGENGPGGTIGAIYAMENKKNGSLEPDTEGYNFNGLTNKYFDRSGNPTLLMAFHKSGPDFLGKVFEANPAFFYGVNNHNRKMINLFATGNSLSPIVTDPSVIDTVVSKSKTYLRSGFQALNTKYGTETRKLMLERLVELKGTESDSALFSKLHLDSSKEGQQVEILVNRANQISPDAKAQLMNTWDAIIESTEQQYIVTLEDGETINVGEWLVHEAYGKSAFQPGPRNFGELIPPLYSIKNGLQEYVNINSEQIDYSFFNQLARNKGGNQFFNKEVQGFDPLDKASNYAGELLIVSELQNVKFNKNRPSLDKDNQNAPEFVQHTDESGTMFPMQLKGFALYTTSVNPDGKYVAVYQKMKTVPKGTQYFNIDNAKFMGYVDPAGLEQEVGGNWKSLVDASNNLSSAIEYNRGSMNNGTKVLSEVDLVGMQENLLYTQVAKDYTEGTDSNEIKCKGS